jgi:hypothetical protein
MFEKGTVFSTNSRILSIDKVDKFDYKSYLLSKNIYFKIYIYNHEVIYKKINILTILDKFREQILNIINKIYPQEQAILLS